MSTARPSITRPTQLACALSIAAGTAYLFGVFAAVPPARQAGVAGWALAIAVFAVGRWRAWRQPS